MTKKPASEIVITDAMATAATRTWNAIAEDVCDCEEVSGIDAAEVVLDANFMQMYGGPGKVEAFAAFDQLCKEHELKDVYRALANRCRF